MLYLYFYFDIISDFCFQHLLFSGCFVPTYMRGISVCCRCDKYYHKDCSDRRHGSGFRYVTFLISFHLLDVLIILTEHNLNLFTFFRWNRISKVSMYLFLPDRFPSLSLILIISNSSQNQPAKSAWSIYIDFVDFLHYYIQKLQNCK